MATLSFTNTFVAGTLAKASEINANFQDMVLWSTTIDNNNLTTLDGPLTWAITTDEEAITISNAGSDGSISIAQSEALDPSKADIRVINSVAQTSGDASVYLNMSHASSTIPVFRADYAGSQVFAIEKSRLEFPVRTEAARDALTGVATGSILIVSDSPGTKNKGLNCKKATGWELFSIPVGVSLPYWGTTAPDGFLMCDGSTVSQATYADLFAVIGHVGGADPGGGNFILPDPKGRTLMGAGTGSGLTARTLGTKVGAETLPSHYHGFAASGTTGVESQSHTHRISDNNGGAGGVAELNVAATGATLNQSFGANVTSDIANQSHTHDWTFTGTTASEGTGSHGVMQPSVTCNFIIKF